LKGFTLGSRHATKKENQKTKKKWTSFSGWWFFTNPSEKYISQNGNHLPQVGVNIKKMMDFLSLAKT